MARETLAALLAHAALLCSPALAGGEFATTVVDFQQGTGGGVFDPPRALGPPRGGGLSVGSLDVCSLGTGGSLTLGFDVVIVDGPGADLIVFENAFTSLGEVFAEAVYVEVSSDGVEFARFPCRYAGPAGPVGAFDTVPFASYVGLAGGTPVLANADVNDIDPCDAALAGGDAFDLALLADHPSVLAGRVDLGAVRFLRLVDVVSGVDLDSFGVPIQDSGTSADIDAVAVLNHRGNQHAGRPRVLAWTDAAGHAHLVVHEPNGLADVDWSQDLRVTLNLAPASWGQLMQSFVPLPARSPDAVHLRTLVPPAVSGMQVMLGVSATDAGGLRSSAQLALAP